ncbi:hypothetical protein L249_8874 [Ophiocordyceps polyrhachis-furcata BCC 54312]|uniref:Mitochondrial thiamine pyrophosphate carrier 1 n=1 Tax=Ophiocordyceps polyrhachis-furcata BCC 54312 TaxID=1330021 RepID=A0A367L1N8_9HYPO|nr:hypothetical protein L249_8874 [Ophiocordyceps polyrhachis-furcata BCC 54312]
MSADGESASKAKKVPSKLRSQAQALAAGGFGGVCAVVVGHPFDLVKVRLQTSSRGTYNGAMDVVRRSVARDGLRRGLYAGVSAPLVGVTPMFAVSFWGYDLGKQIVSSLSPTTASTSLSIGQTATAGFLSAIPMTAITAPFERKTTTTTTTTTTTAPKHHHRNAADVVRHLYKTGGLRSVFRGSAATLARDGPGSAAYFAAYEYIKASLSRPSPSPSSSSSSSSQQQQQQPLSLGAITCAGAAAGVAMWIPVFPVDTVKSRLQTAEADVSISSVVRSLYAQGGFRAFFPGFGPALARAVPANAATFLGVELAHQAMNRMFGPP